MCWSCYLAGTSAMEDGEYGCSFDFWNPHDWPEDRGLYRLEARLATLACEVLGHERGPSREFTALDHRVYRWRACARCGEVLEGRAPAAYEVHSKVLFDTYQERALNESLERRNPLLALFERADRLDRVRPDRAANCVISGITDTLLDG